jgi:hypothetical protein
MMFNKLYVIILVVICFDEHLAEAFDFQMNGFADLVGTKSNTLLPLDNLGNQGNRLTMDPESRLGLNLSADLGNNLTFASQLVAQGNNSGQYNLAVDWLFATYRPTEGLAFRAGRQINPAFLYSEQIDVGFTYLWTRLPYEVYSLDPLDSFNGLAAIYTSFLGDFRLRTEIFGGAGATTVDGSAGTFVGIPNDEKGIEVALLSDHFKFRMGYDSSNPTGTISTSVPIVTVPSGVISGTFTEPADLGTTQIFSTGTSFDYLNFVGSAEVAHLWSNGTLVSSATGAYGSLGYRVCPRLTPYFLYAWQGNLSGTSYVYPDPSISSTSKTDQHSEVFGLNFKMSPAAVLKVEYMRTQENFADFTQNFGANTFTAAVDLVF